MIADEALAILARPIDAEDAVRVALLNQPTVQAALRRVGIARGELVTASLFPNPEIDGSLWFPLEGGAALFEGSLLFDVASMARVGYARGAARAELEAAAIDAAGEILDLAYGTRVAFLRYLADRTVRDELEAIVEAMRASYEAARMLRRAGNVRALELLQEEALFQEARLALARSEIEVLEARERLQVLMGLYGEATEWRAVDALAAPSAPPAEDARLEARAIEASLELRAIDARREASASRVGLARSLGSLPSLQTGLAANHEDRGWALGVSAALELPTFDRNQGGIAAARARLAELDELEAALAVRVRSTIRRARNRMANAYARATFYRDTLVPLRERLLEEMVRQYNAMQLGVFELLTARRAQIETRLEYVRALGAYWVARAAFDQVLGGRLVELGEPLAGDEVVDALRQPTRMPGTEGGRVDR
jgi:outer membrane protein TolC